MHHTDIGSIIIFLKLVCLEQTLADPGLSFGGQIEGRKELVIDRRILWKNIIIIQ